MESFLDISVLKEKIIKTDRVLHMYMEMKNKYSELIKKHKEASSELSLMKLDIEVKTIQLSEQNKINDHLKTEYDKLANDYNSLNHNHNKQLDELVSLQVKYQTLSRDLTDYQNDDKKSYQKDPQIKKKVKKRKSGGEKSPNEKNRETEIFFDQSSDDQKNVIKIEILDKENYSEDYLFADFHSSDSVGLSPSSVESNSQEEKSILLEYLKGNENTLNTQGQEMERKFKQIIEDLQINIEEQNNIFQKKFEEKENEINKKWEERQKKLTSEIERLNKKIKDEKFLLTKSYEEKISALQKEWRRKEDRMEAEIINCRLKSDEEISRLIEEFDAKKASMKKERKESEKKLERKISDLEEQVRTLQKKIEESTSNNSAQNKFQKSDYEPKPRFDSHFEEFNSNANKTQPQLTNCSETEDSESDIDIEDIFKEMRVTLLSPIPELVLPHGEIIGEGNLETEIPEEKFTQFKENKNNIPEFSELKEPKTVDWSNRYQAYRKRKIAKYRKLSEIKKAKQKFWLELGRTNLKKPSINVFTNKKTNVAGKKCTHILEETLRKTDSSMSVGSSMDEKRIKVIATKEDQPKITKYFLGLPKKEHKFEKEEDQPYGVEKNIETQEQVAITDNFPEPPVDQHTTSIENFSVIEEEKLEREIIKNEENQSHISEILPELSKNQADTAISFSELKNQLDVSKENIEIEEGTGTINTFCESSEYQHKPIENFLVFQPIIEKKEVFETAQDQLDIVVNFSEPPKNQLDVVETEKDPPIVVEENNKNIETEEEPVENFSEPPKNQLDVVETEKDPPIVVEENNKNIETEEEPVIINKSLKPPVDEYIELKHYLEENQRDIVGNLGDLPKNEVSMVEYISKLNYENNTMKENSKTFETEKPEVFENSSSNSIGRDNVEAKRDLIDLPKNELTMVEYFSELNDQTDISEENSENIEAEEKPKVFENSSNNSIGQDKVEQPEMVENFPVKNLCDVVEDPMLKESDTAANMPLTVEDEFSVSRDVENSSELIRESCSYSTKTQPKVEEDFLSSDDESLKPKISPTSCKRKKTAKASLMAKSLKIYNLRSCATSKSNIPKEIGTPKIKSKNLVPSNNKKRENLNSSIVESPRVKRRKLSSTVESTETNKNNAELLTMTPNLLSPSFSDQQCDTKIEKSSPPKRENEKSAENNRSHKDESLIKNPQKNSQLVCHSHTTNNKTNANNHSQNQKILASQLDPSKINIIQDLILRPKGKFARRKSTEKKIGGFKRPLSSKIPPACPQSPTLPKGESTNFVEPVIIPLEKPAELEQSVVDELFKKLITYSTEDKTVEEVGKQFSNQEPEYISRLILQQIILDKDKPDVIVLRAPLMTHTQRVMLGFMLKLEKMNVVNIIKTYLRMSELYLIHSKVLSTIESLTRFHVAICKAHGYVEQMRILCLEAFFFMDNLAIPFFFTVLTSWIQVLPPADISEGFPLVRVLVQLVHLKTCNKPGYNLIPLRDLLHQFYEYPNEPWNSDTFFKELFHSYLKNPVAPADLPLILYCRNNTSKWVYQKIDTLIKPILPSVNENFKATLIILIGNLMTHFDGKCNQEYIKSTKEWLEDLLKEEDVSEVVKKSVAYTVTKFPKVLQLPRRTGNSKKGNVQNVDNNCDM